MQNNSAIVVKKVSKHFRLPHEKADSVKSIFVNPFNKNRRKFEVQHALKNIDFEIKKGEFFGIVGRNGSGKSTLLKIIAGIYQPNKGSVSFDGRLVPFIELGVGFNPELTGRENVYLNGALLGFSQKEVDKKYKPIVDFAELERFMDQKLKNYSSGMQVRLAFSVATLLAESDILLIDEVLAVGDAAFQRKCFEYFKKLKKDKKTVVFVSHDMSAVREYCDRAVIIDGGKVLSIGNTDEIAQKYVKLFMEDHVAVAGKDANRWGSGAITTSKVRIHFSDGLMYIDQEIISSKNTESPIVGFRIRSTSGADVTGTNTKVERTSIGRIKANQKVTISWSIPDILADGNYYLDPAVIDNDGITVHDWWDEAITFDVRKDRRLPYTVDPGFYLKITKQK